LQDEAGTVDHLAFENAFEIPDLHGSQIIIENDDIDRVSLDETSQILGLATADAGGWIRLLFFLNDGGDNVSPCRIGKKSKFCEILLDKGTRYVWLG
jgi:hypothetical protein